MFTVTSVKLRQHLLCMTDAANVLFTCVFSLAIFGYNLLYLGNNMKAMHASKNSLTAVFDTQWHIYFKHYWKFILHHVAFKGCLCLYKYSQFKTQRSLSIKEVWAMKRYRGNQETLNIVNQVMTHPSRQTNNRRRSSLVSCYAFVQKMWQWLILTWVICVLQCGQLAF